MKALIPTGLGFNCEYESAKAFEMAGAKADIVDIRDIIAGEVDIFDYQALMLVGGFSYGDDLGSGKAVANLLKYKKIKGRRFIELIREFVAKERVVFGVCNGFQVLIKLGLVPGNCTLGLNDSGRYEDRWIHLGFNRGSPCVAAKGLGEIYLPVRHGEGKIVGEIDPDDPACFARYIDPGTKEPTMTYPLNPNGSAGAVAGLCDSTGRIFGMMPHPEAYLLFENHPHWTRIKRELKDQRRPLPSAGEGLKIFRNIVDYCEKNQGNVIIESKLEQYEPVQKFTYKDSGVDIHAADNNQKIIKEMIKETYSKHVIPDTKGLGSMFAVPPEYKNPLLISGTDSVGTKLRLAFEMNKHDTIGIDSVALCVNDIIRRGAKPLFFLDFIGIGTLEQERVNSIVRGIIEGCRQADCSLIGGETAQLPETYPGREYELAGFSVGIVDKEKMITGDKIRPGDKIIGLASSGIHSNGYTLARNVLLSKNKISDIAFGTTTVGEAMLAPSRIYVRPVMDILEKNPDVITGLANITGSAFNKLKKLNTSVGFRIDKLMEVPKIIQMIKKQGNVSDKEMFSTFNMGTGFVIIARNADFLDGFEERYGYKAEVMGTVDDSGKVKIMPLDLVL